MTHKHGWRSQCDPKDNKLCHYNTFSISFFRIVPRSGGKGTKAQPIGLRLKGKASDRDAVVAHADSLVALLDSGWVPEKKYYTFKP